jgi:hypothetical protein
MRLRRMGMMAVVAVFCFALPADGLSCETMEPCMINGMCMPDGTCQGTPVDGGSCDVPQADATCTVSPGTCSHGRCKGASAPVGTSCGAGCGTCQLAFPAAKSTICTTTPGQAGKPCDPGLGPCFPGTCSAAQFALCQVSFKTCPDIDHNPCTADLCNPSTGQCEHLDVPPCVATCETCNPITGHCEPANVGAACEGSTECTAQGHCESVDTGAGVRGVCLAGGATAPSPTPSPTTELAGSPTPTLTPLPPGICVGDCNGGGDVTVNELITLVNIALGNSDVSACTQGIPASVSVDISLTVRAVNNALNGCPSP